MPCAESSASVDTALEPAPAAAAPVAELRFTTEAMLGSAHVFAADGVVHSLPAALCEVFPKPVAGHAHM